MTDIPDLRLPTSIREAFESGQLPLSPDFIVKDVPAAEAAKEDALRRVDEHADEDWKERALTAVLRLCRGCDTFVSDDVWELIEKPREPRALGPILMRATKLGYCRPSGRYVECKVPSRHRAPIREYTSLLR